MTAGMGFSPGWQPAVTFAGWVMYDDKRSEILGSITLDTCRSVPQSTFLKAQDVEEFVQGKATHL